jgi:cytochrome c peroxidase
VYDPSKAQNIFMEKLINVRLSALVLFVFSILLIASCKKDSNTTEDPYPAITRTFSSININSLQNYGNQAKPAYIQKTNAPGSAINDAKATLGRVLFYDKNLSVDNTISCGSCHRQAVAFSDTFAFSNGVLGGSTGRHSMRLVNTKFANEIRFFWNERAPSLALQTTQPIKDHGEMGFSGEGGRPAFGSLLTKLESIDYYREFFTLVYNDTKVTEARLQECLSQFILSIQSFDSKYDIGRAAAPNDNVAFSNFSASENQGKQLFLAPPAFNPAGVRIGGGAGCQGCHQSPEFDIDPNSRNNGVIASKDGGVDLTNTRSPTLRDLFNEAGNPNGPFMHTGKFRGINAVIDHYNNIPGGNLNLDPKLFPGGRPQQLALTETEKQNLGAFIKTLSGKDMYTNVKWSNPF